MKTAAAPPALPRTQTEGEGAKRKRLSKKGKKNWRKNVDISDVEAALELQREDEQRGGALGDRPNQDLFFVDTEKAVVPRQSSRQAKKDAARAKASWDERLQENTSKVHVDRNRKSSTKIRGHMNLQKPTTASTPPVNDEPEEAELWSRKESRPDNEYVAAQTEETVKRPKLPVRKAKVKPVEMAAPGASYNPTYNDHQALLREAVDKEQAKVDEEARLKEELERNVSPSDRPFIHGVDDVAPVEASESDNEEEDMGEAEAATSLPPPPVPKTKKQRRKQKAHQEKMEAARVEKARRRREAEAFRTKKIIKDIEGSEKERVEQRERRAAIDDERNDGVQRLGRHKIKDQNVDVKLTEELVGTLRELKPEGSLIRDRFINFQKRNILPPRRIHASRQKKTFAYIKKDFKASKLPFFGGETPSEA